MKGPIAVLLSLLTPILISSCDQRSGVEDSVGLDEGTHGSEAPPEMISPGISGEVFWEERERLIRAVKFENSADAANLLAIKCMRYGMPEAAVFWLEEARRLGLPQVDESLIETVRSSVLSEVEE